MCPPTGPVPLFGKETRFHGHSRGGRAQAHSHSRRGRRAWWATGSAHGGDDDDGSPGALRWAEQFDGERRWGVEDCRHLSRRLERDLLSAGESIVRVPPKLMAHVRDSARTYGKSDPIDALAVARAALREPNLPTARLDGPDRTVRLLVDHREALVSERTRVICRLRWHLHELDPAWEPGPRALDRSSAYEAVEAHLDGVCLLYT